MLVSESAGRQADEDIHVVTGWAGDHRVGRTRIRAAQFLGISAVARQETYVQAGEFQTPALIRIQHGDVVVPVQLRRDLVARLTPTDDDDVHPDSIACCRQGTPAESGAESSVR